MPKWEAKALPGLFPAAYALAVPMTRHSVHCDADCIHICNFNRVCGLTNNDAARGLAGGVDQAGAIDLAGGFNDKHYSKDTTRPTM